MQETRASLIDRLSQPADEEAWGLFERCYKRPLYAYARKKHCSDATALDVVQETMVDMYRNRNRFRYDPRKGRFRSFLFTVLSRKIARLRRRNGPELISAANFDLLLSPENRELQPDQAFEEAETQAMMLEVFEEVRRDVDPATFQAFELMHLQGLSGAEASAMTGLSRNAVYLAAKRVQRKLSVAATRYDATLGSMQQMKQAFELVQAESFKDRTLSMLSDERK